MDARVFSRARLLSRCVTGRFAHASGRSNLHAMGLSGVFEEMRRIEDLESDGESVAHGFCHSETMLQLAVLLGKRASLAGRTLAENGEHLVLNQSHEVVGPANRPVTVTDGNVALAECASWALQAGAKDTLCYADS